MGIVNIMAAENLIKHALCSEIHAKKVQVKKVSLMSGQALINRKVIFFWMETRHPCRCASRYMVQDIWDSGELFSALSYYKH